ncbi:MAG: ATP-binding protein [Blastocatellia bacterium]
MDQLTAALPPETEQSRKGTGSRDYQLLLLAGLAIIAIILAGFFSHRHHYCLLLYLIPSLLTFGLHRRRLIYGIGVIGIVATMIDCVMIAEPGLTGERIISGYFSILLQSMICYLALRQWRYLLEEQSRRRLSDAQLREISTELVEIERHQRRLERRNRELAALNEIASTISRAASLDAAFRFALRSISQLTAHEAVIMLRDDDEKLVFADAKRCGFGSTDLAQWLTKLDEDLLLRYVRQQNAPGIIEDERAESELAPALRDYGFVSYVVVPIADGEKRLGALILASCTSRQMTAEDLSFLSAVTNQLAGAIERARLAHEAETQAIRQLALERRMTRLLTENAPVAIAHLTPELNYVMANPIYLELIRNQTGEAQLELVGINLGDAAPQLAEGHAWADSLQQLLLRSQPFTFQAQPSASRADGLTSSWDWTVWPVRDDEGAIESVLLMGADVTKRIEAERNLETALEAAWTERNKQEAVIERITDAVFIADASSRNVVRVNSAGARLLGYESPFQLEKSLDTYPALLSPRLPDGKPLQPERFLLNRALRGEEVRDDHLMLRRLDGSLIHVIAGASPVRNASGEIVLAVGILHDVTSLLNIQTELEKSNQSKDLFLAMLSHELRTPLTPILGWSKIMHENVHDPVAVQQGVEAIERNARMQSQLVDDLLDMSRIIAGKIELNRSPQDFNQIIRYALETVQTRIDTQMLDLDLDLAAGVLPVYGDPTRLEQVIWNLLANAVKFTPTRGRIRITSRRIQQYCQIEVADNGIGIDPEMLDVIFEHFQQVESGTSRRHGGLGIGLAIARSLVEMHGGWIRAESAGAGCGSTFTVIIPLYTGHLNQRPGSDKRQEKMMRLTGTKVLVLEDSDDSRELFGMVLRSRGCEVELAESVIQALELASSQQPDIVISDIGLPDIDGYEFVRRLRQMKGLERVPVIALSGYATEKDKRRSSEAGFDLHLAKPIEPDQIINSVHDVLSRSGR